MFPDVTNDDVNIFDVLTSISQPFINSQNSRMNTNSIGYFVSDYMTVIHDNFDFVNNPFLHTLSKINEYKSLNENWDGYGSIPVTKKSEQNTITFITNLDDVSIENISDIFPNPHGTITLEWENKLCEKISLEIGSNSYSYFVKYSNKTPKFVDGTDIFSSITEITSEINSLVSKEVS